MVQVIVLAGVTVLLSRVRKCGGSLQWTSMSLRGNNNISPSEAGISFMVYAQLPSLPLYNLVSNLDPLWAEWFFYRQVLRHLSSKQPGLIQIIAYCTILLDRNSCA